MLFVWVPCDKHFVIDILWNYDISNISDICYTRFKVIKNKKLCHVLWLSLYFSNLYVIVSNNFRYY